MAADSKPLPGSTLPGTTLKFGQEAIITAGTGPRRSLVGLTVTGVERGTADDSAALRAAMHEAEDRPVDTLYLIKAVRENKDGKLVDTGSPGPLLRGVTGNGEEAGGIRLFFTELGLASCTVGERPPASFATKGGRHELCQLVFAPPGDPVTTVGLQVQSGEPDITWE